jgi:hypothetical protein
MSGAEEASRDRVALDLPHVTPKLIADIIGKLWDGHG